MIPKTIHYCWFGGKPLPDLAQRCIASWEKYMPGWEIKRWDESNFDLDVCAYVREAYAHQKWAFVTDYARFWILHKFGGVYLDTDVELIKPIDAIVELGSYMGCEYQNMPINGTHYLVATGLGMGAEKGLPLYEEVIAKYRGMCYAESLNDANTMNVVVLVTSILRNHGYKGSGAIEHVAGITIYPPDYFCPLNSATGKLTITENTYSIHHYMASWVTKTDKLVLRIERCDADAHPLEYKLRRICSLPFRVISKIQKDGIRSAWKLTITKLCGKKEKSL